MRSWNVEVHGWLDVSGAVATFSHAPGAHLPNPPQSGALPHPTSTAPGWTRLRAVNVNSGEPGLALPLWA